MTEYLKILYWTQITDDNVSFRPVFFFHPRVDILAFLEDRRYRDIPIQIRNTNGLYDGFHYATMDIATGLGACPADLDPVKPVYAATLASLSFTLYPTAPFVGEFAVLMDAPREKKDKDVLEAFQPAAPTPAPPTVQQESEETETACFKKSGTKYWVFVVVFFLVLILLILLCFLPKK
ncbi:hypothetical protein EBZ80_03540 [bacterium]|nr:hypothetical protein [bacterium]